MRRRFAAIGLLAVVAACGQLAGLDDLRYDGAATGGATSSAATGMGGSTSSSGGGGAYVSECPEGTVEVPAVPDGWSGLYAIARNPDDSALPACEQGATLTLHDELTAPPATCPCSCGQPLLGRCTGSLRHFAASDTTCTGTVVSSASMVWGCNQLTQVAVVPSDFVADPAPAGICDASAEPQPALSPAIWGNHLRACELTVDSVDELGCTAAPPSAFEPRLCVVRAGMHECPGPLSDRLTLTFHTDVVDTRACADDCSCAPGAVVCGGAFRMYGMGDSSCSQNWTSFSGCSFQGNELSAYYDASVAGSCTPVDATSIGSVTPATPTTICCAQ